MEYFWRQQDDIPAGMGYPLFGAAHLLSVGITLLFVVLLIMVVRRLEDRQQRRVLKTLPIFMVVLEVFKDAFLISIGRFGIGYLPLHVCSIGIFVFLLRELLPWKLAKEISGEISFILIMPASVAALLFADWTVFYPVANFMNIYSYMWHGALILYPALLMARGDIKPSIRHIHYVLLFLCAVVPAVYAFDKRFGCNYFFVNWPVQNSPLSWMAQFMGNPGYLVGYGALTLVVILLIYLGIEIKKTKKYLLSIIATVIILGLIYLAVVLIGEAVNEQTISLSGPYDVIRVIDGDTIVVDIDGEDIHVRLIGINTPELTTDDGETIEAGELAKEYTTTLLEGNTVYLEYDAELYDVYGRTLAYVYLPDKKTMVNELLLKNGYAEIMTIEPNVKYKERFLFLAK